jgi:hypothetical protein
MLKRKSNAINKISNLVSASLQKIENIRRPCFKFLCTVFELWLGLPVRYTDRYTQRSGKIPGSGWLFYEA